MPIPYQHKRSTAAGVEPTTLQDGEIAINVAAADPKIFFKDSASTIRAFSLASYASATHSHVVADVTDFTTKANVVSVNGITGVVSLSHTSVSAAAASHTHSASQISVSQQGQTAFIGPSASYFLHELDSDGLGEAIQGLGGLLAADITDFATEAAKYGPVTSVNSLTGTIVLTSLGVSAASAVHTHVAADITDFSSAVASASPEEVVEYLTTSVFPATGSTTVLYLATDASRAYRWTGSEYVEVGTSSLSASGGSSAGGPSSRALTFLVR